MPPDAADIPGEGRPSLATQSLANATGCDGEHFKLQTSNFKLPL